MGRRLPEGEAERRAMERKRATFSGENYRTYDVEKEGYGNQAQWEAAAAAFANGEDFIYIETSAPKFGQSSAKPEASKARRPANPLLDMFGLDELPMDVKTFTGAYRRTVKAAFMEHGSKDTSPAYVKAFMELTKAYDRYKMQKGW